MQIKQLIARIFIFVGGLGRAESLFQLIDLLVGEGTLAAQAVSMRGRKYVLGTIAVILFGAAVALEADHDHFFASEACVEHVGLEQLVHVLPELNDGASMQRDHVRLIDELQQPIVGNKLLHGESDLSICWHFGRLRLGHRL